MTVAPTRDQPGRSPQGAAPVKPPLPTGPPEPALMAVGFNGSITDFNHRLDAVTQAHTAVAGTRPTPGVALDVARSSVPVEHFGPMFTQAPQTGVQARAQNALTLQRQQNPYDYLHHRDDGVAVPITPLTVRLHPQGPPLTPAGLAAAHPWVPQESGFLPIASFGRLVGALATLDKGGVGTQNGQVTVGGQTLADYQKQTDFAAGAGTLSQPAAPPGSSVAQQEQQTREAQQGAIKANTVTTAVTTVRQAQKELRQEFPAYFAHLPADGNFNQDWVGATARFQSSATYYRAATTQLAHDNHFDHPAEFIKAWKAKQAAIRQGGTGATFYESVPLAYFGNGKSVLNYIDGDTHGWGFINVPTVALHSLVGLGKTVVFGASATVSGLKSNAAAMTAYLDAVAPGVIGGKGEGQKEAADHAVKVAQEHPSYLRIFYPDLPAHPHGALAAADSASNLILDIVLGNKLVVGGSAVKAGDYAALRSNRYYKGATQLAYNSLKRRGIDGVGEASKLIQGGETLNVALADGVKAGDVTLAQYRAHIADLYHHGQTEFGDTTLHAAETPNAGVLTTLREKNLPNTSLLHQQVKQGLNQFDAGLRNSGLRGTSNAADMFSSVRQLIARAAPRTEVRRIYDPKTPDDVFNWVVRNLGDREAAYKARNTFVVARAREDIPAVNELNKSLLERYAASHPNVKGVRTPLTESEGPNLEAESLSNFKFLTGREKDTQGVFTALAGKSKALNGKLLTLARYHRQIIISGAPLPGGESLFYKHAVADTLRRFVGGAGLRFSLNPGQRTALADAQGFFKANPAALRDYSANRAAAEMGEVAWLTRNRPESWLSFNTGDHFNDAKRMAGAGAYLRHMVTDDALNAYRQSTAADKTALFRHVWGSSFYQNKIATSEDFLKDAQQIKTMVKDGGEQRRLLSELKKSYAQDHADALWNQYRAVDEAGTKAGLPSALELAAQEARLHPGAKIDTALGNWIQRNRVAFDVRDAPVMGTQFDGLMQAWVGKLLTFNKLNRRTFFDHIFADSYGELVGAGFEKADAVAAATQLARVQTVYHMLDFSNMLQVEQNLRWVSYYATKHRLYWTWIARQFAKKPLLAQAVTEIGNMLDSRGNLPVTVFGHRMVVPASRLVWANNTEYPETSPPVEAGVRFARNLVSGENLGNAVADAFAQETATSGNVITRQDQAIADLVRSVAVLSGHAPATFGFAVAGMSPAQRASFNKQMHGYILGYRADHSGRYPSEADAVKATLLRSTGMETWRTNLFVPILPDTGQTSHIQDLHKQFDKITNPRKRRDFLDKHPELQDSFGASQDQNIYLHQQPLWDQFNRINADREAALESVRQQIDKTGYTTTTAADVKAISAKYGADIQRLRRLDALTWKGDTTYPAGRVADNGEIQVEGPWAQQLDGDPLAARAFLHQAFPDISNGQLDKHTIGQTVLDLQNEAARIKSLGWQKLGYPDPQHARDRLSQIAQKLDVFRSFPKTATQQMVDSFYSKYVDPYRAQRDAWVARLATVASADKNAAFAEFRAWKETHDHPVAVTDPVSGVKAVFPSPASWGFTELPPDEYRTALAQAASARWQDISGYEKTLLGVKTPPNVAEGWSQYQQAVTQYRAANPGSSLVEFQKRALARQVDRDYPGFYKDYLFSEQPKVRRYEATSLYQTLPARTLFDQYIGDPAKTTAAAVKANGHSAYYLGHWRDYVKQQILPWLVDHPELKQELARYGPDFLNTLPSR